jgi:hypothetical protein
MRRAIIVWLVCIVVGVVVQSVNAASGSLKDLQLSIINVAPSGIVTVRMANSSRQKTLRVWIEANSWGALRWRVLVLRKGQVLVVFEDPDEVLFTKNIPIPDEIAVGSHIDRKLDVNGKYWSRARTGKLRFEPSDQLIVIYDVPPEVEAQKMHVRYGVAGTSTIVK